VKPSPIDPLRKPEPTFALEEPPPSSVMSERARETAARTGIAFGWVTRDLLTAGKTMARLVAGCEAGCRYHLGTEVEVPVDEELRKGLFSSAERAVYRTMELEAVKYRCSHWEDFREDAGLERRVRMREYSRGMARMSKLTPEQAAIADHAETSPSLPRALAEMTGIALGAADSDEKDQLPLAGMLWIIAGCEFCGYSIRTELEASLDQEDVIERVMMSMVETMTRAADSKACPHWSAYLWRRGWTDRPTLPAGS